MANTNMNKAKLAKNDEFYTQLTDIEKELKHYKEQFKDKVVLCNCDDPEWSNFYKFFRQEFELKDYGIKKLIFTHYDSDGLESDADKAYALIIERDNEDNVVERKEFLSGIGDFRDSECLEYLKQSDIIVTNPPFSLFREFVAILEAHDKKFLVIGSGASVTYKEIFKLIKENKMWLGMSSPKDFIQPDGNVKGVFASWFTNLENENRKEILETKYKYKGNEKNYRKYYNFDAIHIGKVNEIPMDYDGYMGVPVTFIDKYNPKQFEIVGLGMSSLGKEIGVKDWTKEHKEIRKKQGRGAANGDLYFFDNGVVEKPYVKMIIKRKKED